jgi:hypothetical protein
MESTFIWREFYKRLSFHYYGIASAANKTSSDDMEFLKKKIRMIWKEYQPILPDFHADTMDNTETTFDWLNLNETPWEYCANELKVFLNLYSDQFTDDMKNFILKSSQELASSLSARENPCNKTVQLLIGSQAT